MYYIIQENVFRDTHYDSILDALNRLRMEYEIVWLDNKETFDFKTHRKDIFCFGSMKLARLAKKNAWYPGSLMNENHDYLVYSEYWKGYLLNSDSITQPLDKPIDFTEDKKFIRPTKDSKIFTGGVFAASEWASLLEKVLKSQRAREEMIQVAIPKKIFQEIRCWIVNQKLVTASTYKIGNQVRYNEYVDTSGLSFAQEMVDIYQPAEAFVLDICLSNEGWKIVEVNCINSAGFYASNLQKLIIELEDYYNPYQE
jgi:hypothetical protein